mmetsp:Transcript_6087/g.14569  ORF Transcript_6087/g.14569 Transcript_6087/m.14569 type:complete len:262 (+) Transcript_6087:544-1329(+)
MHCLSGKANDGKQPLGSRILTNCVLHCLCSHFYQSQSIAERKTSRENKSCNLTEREASNSLETVEEVRLDEHPGLECRKAAHKNSRLVHKCLFQQFFRAVQASLDQVNTYDVLSSPKHFRDSLSLRNRSTHPHKLGPLPWKQQDAVGGVVQSLQVIESTSRGWCCRNHWLRSTLVPRPPGHIAPQKSRDPGVSTTKCEIQRAIAIARQERGGRVPVQEKSDNFRRRIHARKHQSRDSQTRLAVHVSLVVKQPDNIAQRTWI